MTPMDGEWKSLPWRFYLIFPGSSTGVAIRMGLRFPTGPVVRPQRNLIIILNPECFGVGSEFNFAKV
jgi:hypothetical protein